MRKFSLVCALLGFFICLITLVKTQASIRCLDGNTEGKYIGPFNQPLTEAERNTFYRVRGAPCVTCEIDCLANIQQVPGQDKKGNPFVSCPCRYIRYGCPANQPCVDMNSTTPRQWDAAVQLCLAYGCVTKSDVSSPNFDNKLYAYSPGQAIWRTTVRSCYGANSNPDTYNRKRAYYEELNTDTSRPAINPNSANLRARSCELGAYRGRFETLFQQFKSGRATVRQVQQAAYQYASYAIDPSSPFLMYQFLILSRGFDLTNNTQRTQLMNHVNSMLGNINRDVLARNALFRITDVELNSLLEQYRTCGFGKTRGDAFTDLIDKFVIALQYRSSCASENGGATTHIETYFDAQYKRITQSLGISLQYLYDTKDMGRNFIYPFLFKTSDASRISFLASDFNAARDLRQLTFEFTRPNFSLCPTFATLPQCVRSAMARGAAPDF